MNVSFVAKSSVVSVAVLLVLISSMYIVFFSEESDTTQLLGINSSIPNAPPMEIDKTEKTIATVWQWENSPSTPLERSSRAFSEDAVYSALHRVRLDNQNNVIVDHVTLIALNETLDDSRLQLDDQALSELQIIIRQGLPNDAGHEVASIVGDYYHYLQATREFNAVYESDPSIAQGIESTIEELEANYRELMELRELYLGTDVATKLFSTTNANANYMFDMFSIEQNTHFSDEEKQKSRAEITGRHAEQTINVNNWNMRHQTFLVAKQNIVMATVSEEDKQAQLTELMHQHFGYEELAYVRHLQLDRP